MKRCCLDGIWERSVNGRPFLPQRVPYSALCAGESVVRTRFDAESGKRAVLCLEGITYRAEARLNGHALGSMLPYCRYRFEVGELLQEKGNALEIALWDRGMKYGPTEGWENYGGVIRSVYLEYPDAVSVEDVFWHCTFSPACRVAHCTAEVRTQGAFRVRAELTDPAGDAVSVCEINTADGSAALRWDVERPGLWSPETPVLYTLRVTALDEKGAARGDLEQKVGFRVFNARGRQFMLNGKPYFLKGVCRHDMWGGQGHTLTDEQIRRDLSLIKAAGCNFVRLVHYPHDARVLDAADELGLFLCEESGLWWSDVTDPEVYGPALQVMEKTILRDRNHPCVAFWLSFNECVFTEEFLRASVAVCKRCDPYRMVSGANCMNPEKTKEIFSAAGFDFYTFHPYGPDESTIMGGIDAKNPHQTLDNVYDTLNDKPLLFTEWGGCHVEDNVFTFTRMVKNLLRANREGRLAGFSYWVWADMYEFGRGEPGCFDGILREGMVDTERRPHAILSVFRDLVSDPALLDEKAPCLREGGFSVPAGEYRPLDVPRGDAAQEAAWDQAMALCERQQGFRNKPFRRMAHGPVLPWEVRRLGNLPVALPAGRPAVILKEEEFPLDAQADALYIVGCVTLPWGYPQYGAKGESAGALTVVYADGTETRIPLRNGIETTGAIASAGPSRLDAQAEKAEVAFTLVYDPNWEHYVAQALCVPVENKRIRALRLECVREDSALLLYGVTAFARERSNP